MSHTSSRVDIIREHALALLALELSDETPTPILPVRASRAPIALRNRPPVQQETSIFGHVLTFVIFVALSFALFTAVTR